MPLVIARFMIQRTNTSYKLMPSEGYRKYEGKERREKEKERKRERERERKRRINEVMNFALSLLSDV